MRYGQNQTRDAGRNFRHKSSRKRRNALKMAILTMKSKIFIKAKLTVSKSCLLGQNFCFMIREIVNLHLDFISIVLLYHGTEKSWMLEFIRYAISSLLLTKYVFSFFGMFEVDPATTHQLLFQDVPLKQFAEVMTYFLPMIVPPQI